jgi:hypothetical protein
LDKNATSVLKKTRFRAVSRFVRDFCYQVFLSKMQLVCLKTKGFELSRDFCYLLLSGFFSQKCNWCV